MNDIRAWRTLKVLHPVFDIDFDSWDRFSRSGDQKRTDDDNEDNDNNRLEAGVGGREWGEMRCSWRIGEGVEKAGRNGKTREQVAGLRRTQEEMRRNEKQWEDSGTGSERRRWDGGGRGRDEHRREELRLSRMLGTVGSCQDELGLGF